MALGLPGYPQPLAKVPAPPPLLYVRGEWLEADANSIGIVGSRNCTTYGQKIAAQLARELARAGFTIISGLARGIDGAAHRAALEVGGRTVAALAGGLSKIDAPDKTRRRVIGTLACFGSGGVGLGFWERLRLGFGPR